MGCAFIFFSLSFCYYSFISRDFHTRFSYLSLPLAGAGSGFLAEFFFPLSSRFVVTCKQKKESCALCVCVTQHCQNYLWHFPFGKVYHHRRQARGIDCVCGAVWLALWSGGWPRLHCLPPSFPNAFQISSHPLQWLSISGQQKESRALLSKFITPIP